MKKTKKTNKTNKTTEKQVAQVVREILGKGRAIQDLIQKISIQLFSDSPVPRKKQ